MYFVFGLLRQKFRFTAQQHGKQHGRYSIVVILLAAGGKVVVLIKIIDLTGLVQSIIIILCGDDGKYPP